MRFTARCLCGPRVRPVNIAFDAHHAIATDAHQKGGRADPTGTMPLQQRWNRALDQRWSGLKRLIPQAIENHVNPIQAIAHSAITGRPDAISSFQAWLDEALKQVILGNDGSWLLPYVRNATDKGAMHARSATTSVGDAGFNEEDHPRDEHGRWTEAEGAPKIDKMRTDIVNGDPKEFKTRLKWNENYDQVTISGGTVYPALRVVDRKTGKVAGVLVGKRGDAHGDVATAHGIDSELVAGGVRHKEGTVDYERGFVQKKNYYHAEDVELDTAVLAPQSKYAAKDAADTTPQDRTHLLQSLAIAELQGIIEAVSQQAVRALANGLMSKLTYSATARNVKQVLDTVGVRRSHMLVSFMTVKAFTAATLDGLRARGIARVGVVPERRPRPTVTDAKGGTKGMVAVQTAEDKFVCDECQEIADDGPYYIDEAEALIPAHPNCRCLLVPADDEEYADLTGLEPDDIEDSATHIGAGVMITADNTGRTLFVRRGKGGDQAGTWAFPGGAVEAGETPQMAARRETQEEIGYDVGDDAASLDRRTTGGVDFTTYGHTSDVEFRPHLNHEHDAHKWAYLESAPEPLHPGVAATLDNWDHAMRTRDEASWNEEDHPRDKDGKFAFAAASADTTDKVHAVKQDLTKKGVDNYYHFPPGTHGHSSLNEVHSFEVMKADVGSFHNALAKQGLAATEVKPLSGKDFTMMYAVGEPKSAAPHEAAPPPVVEHPLQQHLSSVQGKSTERVALRKQMDSAKGDELKQLQAKHNASFWKEHQALTKAGKIEKADDIAKKLDNYSKKYGISNPLKQGAVSPATKAKAAAMVEKAAIEFAAKVNVPATEATHSASGKIDSPTEAATLAKAIKANGSPSVEHHPAENKTSPSEQQFHSYSVNSPGELTKMNGLLEKGGYQIHETYSGTANVDGEWKTFHGVKVPVGYKVEPAPKATNTNKTPKVAAHGEAALGEEFKDKYGVDFKYQAAAGTHGYTVPEAHLEEFKQAAGDYGVKLEGGEQDGSYHYFFAHEGHVKGETKLDINKPSDNFEQMLKNEGVKYEKDPLSATTTFLIKSHHETVEEAQKYHPDVQKISKHEYVALNSPSTAKTEASKTAPIEAPHHEPIDFNSLHKVGEQKGSNPGGVYEDKSKGETGDHPQYYVKSMDEAHSKNETLAAKLYALAGSKTLDYVPVKPNGDTHYVATKFEKLDKGNVSQLDATERKQAQHEFATHAWLANWDSAGTGGDNQGVKNGAVKTLDVGGALEYRAKGTPKGELFGDKVTEWDTMRTGSKNPDAVGLYGNMTKTQLDESAKKVLTIKPSDIVATVQSVYGPGTKANDLSTKLIARQNDIASKIKDAHEAAAKEASGIKEAPALDKTKTKEQQDILAVQKVAGYVPSKAETDKINKQYNLDLQPAHVGAIQAYVGSAYSGLNSELRKTKGQSLDVIKYAKVLDDALSKMPVYEGTVHRGINSDPGNKVFESYAKHVGQVVTETQFTSAGKAHKLWGKTTLHIDTKTAADISAFNSHEGGGEVILRKGTHLYVKKVDHKSHTVWLEEV